MFGQNLVHEGIGELAVGDEVTVLDPSQTCEQGSPFLALS
jgi:hypothetical protein